MLTATYNSTAHFLALPHFNVCLQVLVQLERNELISRSAVVDDVLINAKNFTGNCGISGCKGRNMNNFDKNTTGIKNALTLLYVQEHVPSEKRQKEVEIKSVSYNLLETTIETAIFVLSGKVHPLSD